MSSLSKQAVCCEDKLHCCPEATTCDLEHSKCIHSSTKKEMPMWAKLPARTRAEWEYPKGQIRFCFSLKKKKKDLLPLRSHDSLSKSWCVFFVESEPVVAEPVHNGTLEKVPEVTTANPVPPTDWEVTVSSVTTAAAGEIFIYLCGTSSTPKNK